MTTIIIISDSIPKQEPAKLTLEVSKEDLAFALRDIVDTMDWSTAFREPAEKAALDKARELLTKLGS